MVSLFWVKLLFWVTVVFWVVRVAVVLSEGISCLGCRFDINCVNIMVMVSIFEVRTAS